MAGNASTSEFPAAIEGIPGRGEVIGDKYVIEHFIGVGGMGVVLAARHRQLNQPVAIKMLLPKIATNAEAVARFLREAQAAVNIQSEHVARVLDVGSLPNSIPYMVLEFLQGTNLAQVLVARGPLPIPEAVAYVLQACEALAEAHFKGIVHRDLKPSNLFLTVGPGGSPLIKILDFGIAKMIEPDSEDSIKLTGTGVGMGSPQYMSPEQIRDTSGVDARTDIWSLGITLFELLTRELPFSGTNFAALCAQIIADPPIRLRQVLPDAPAELEQILLGCLEKSLPRRFSSVAELAQALLPFAPKRSELSVERISSILQRNRAGEPDIPSERHNSQRLDGISGALSTTVSGSSRPSMVLVGVLGSAALLLTAALLFWVSQRPQPEPPESGAPATPPLSAAPVTASTAPSVIPSAPASVELASAPPGAVAASSPSALRQPSSCPGGRPCRRVLAAPSKRSPGATSAASKGASNHDPLDDRK